MKTLKMLTLSVAALALVGGLIAYVVFFIGGQ